MGTFVGNSVFLTEPGVQRLRDHGSASWATYHGFCNSNSVVLISYDGVADPLDRQPVEPNLVAGNGHESSLGAAFPIATIESGIPRTLTDITEVLGKETARFRRNSVSS